VFKYLIVYTTLTAETLKKINYLSETKVCLFLQIILRNCGSLTLIAIYTFGKVVTLKEVICFIYTAFPY